MAHAHPDESRERSGHDWWPADGVTYLNHGSFGLAPLPVREARRQWLDQLEANPMDFFVRRLEPALDEAADRLSTWLGCEGRDLVFVPNATAGMNIIAQSLPLEAGDEVLLTDHEYGAVRRIWGRRCAAVGAKTTLAALPTEWGSPDEVLDALFGRVTPRTRVIVVSHITSQTSLEFPVAAICQQARQNGLLTCIDGPHALAQTSVQLRQIAADFYTASCHKWLSAPLGSGFLFVRREHQSRMQPVVTSWGRSLGGRSPRWQDEFHWPGTYDPTPALSIPAAIEFLEGIGGDEFRDRTRSLAALARDRLTRECSAVPLQGGPGSGLSMVTLHLPDLPRSESWPGQPHPLQTRLWEDHRIEIPLFEWHERMHLRVSCHLYNTPHDIDRLVSAMQAATNSP